MESPRLGLYSKFQTSLGCIARYYFSTHTHTHMHTPVVMYTHGLKKMAILN